MTDNHRNPAPAASQSASHKSSMISELLKPKWSRGQGRLTVGQTLGAMKESYRAQREAIQQRLAHRANGSDDEIPLGGSASNFAGSMKSVSSIRSAKHRDYANRMIELLISKGAMKQPASTREREDLQAEIAEMITDEKRVNIEAKEAIKGLETPKTTVNREGVPGEFPGVSTISRVYRTEPDVGRKYVPPQLRGANEESAQVTDDQNPLVIQEEVGGTTEVMNSGERTGVQGILDGLEDNDEVTSIHIPIPSKEPGDAERVRNQILRMSEAAEGRISQIEDQGIRFTRKLRPYNINTSGNMTGDGRKNNEGGHGNRTRGPAPSVSQRDIQNQWNDETIHYGTGQDASMADNYNSAVPAQMNTVDGDQVIVSRKVNFQDNKELSSASTMYRGGGISIVRELAGVNTPEGRFLERKTQELRTLIQTELARVVSGTKGPDGKVRAPKVLSPVDSKYAGTEDSARFMQILVGQLKYFAGNWMTGKEHDDLRVNIMEQSLTGRALKWYNDNVLKDRVKFMITWEYEDIVVAMYEHFIHPRLIEDREKDFNDIQYKFSGTEGIYEFHQRLKNASDEMVYPLSDAEFCKRMFDGLPEDMRFYLAERGVNPFYCSALGIVRVGSQWEKAVKILKQSEARIHKIRPPVTKGRSLAPPKNNEGRVITTPYSAERTGRERSQLNREKQDAAKVVEKFKYKTVEGGKTREEEKCHQCGGVGHRQYQCPSRKPRPQASMHAISDETQEDKDTGDEDAGEDSAEDEEEENIAAMNEAASEAGSGEYDGQDNYYYPNDGGHGWYDRAESDEERMGCMNDEVDDDDDEVVYMAAMDPEPIMDRPKRSNSDRACLVVMVPINGVPAMTLFDTGCSMDSVTPAFVEAAGIPTGVLRKPIPLQLGTVGSKSQISRGTRTSIKVGPVDERDYYLDVSNVAKYDAILGTPFMRRNKLAISYALDAIVFPDGSTIPGHRETDETIVEARRAAMGKRPEVTSN